MNVTKSIIKFGNNLDLHHHSSGCKDVKISDPCIQYIIYNPIKNMLNHFFHDKQNVYIYNHRESNLKQSVSHAKTCSRFTILCNQTQDVISFLQLV